MNSESGIIGLLLFLSFPICSFGPQLFVVSRLIPCIIFYLFLILGSAIFPEKRIQPLRGIVLSLCLCSVLQRCLRAWNFTCYLPDVSKAPCNPHLKSFLSYILHFLYSTSCLTSLRSATFYNSSSVFCHSWVPEMPLANLKILSFKTLWTNWLDLASFSCSYVCHCSGLTSSTTVAFRSA